MDDQKKLLQIQAILNLEFFTGLGPLSVTRPEIREYVEAHGLPERVGRGCDIGYERVGDTWRVDYYEKNVNIGQKQFSDPSAALEAILDEALPTYVRFNPRELVVMDSRPMPHESLSPSAADFLLKMWSDSAAKYTDRVLSGQHQDALIGQFRGLTRYLSELAIVRYFRAGVAAEETLALLNQAALASVNLFKLIDGNADAVNFEWQGQTLTAPAFKSVNSLLTSDLSQALILARISGNAGYMNSLTSFEIDVYEPRLPANSLQVLHCQYTQALFRGADDRVAKIRDILMPHIPTSNDPDIVFGATNQRVRFAIPDNDAKQLSKSIDQHLAAHRHRFDDDRNNNRVHILGLMSFSMLAAIIEARRRNIDIRIRNPYVPEDIQTAAMARL